MKKIPPLSQPKPVRNSSVELFRIVATFAVMIAHFNGWFLDMPNQYDGTDTSVSFVFQNIIRSASSVCVNLFLVISGWYGVKLKARSVWNLGVMLFFIYVPFELIGSALSSSFSIKELLFSMLPFSGKGYYIQCYLMLLILSPMFNAFIEQNEKKMVLRWTLLFFFVEFWYDIIRHDAAAQFNGGYSVLHFCVMYMLGRCFNMYKDEVLKINTIKYVIGYFVCVAIITMLFFLKLPRSWAYSNPLVILASFCAFAPFVKTFYYRKWINWFASSTLAVFIMHTCGFFHSFLVSLAKDSYLCYSYWQYCLFIFLVQIGVFIVCVLYDKLRRFITEPITNYIYNYLVKLFTYVRRPISINSSCNL